MIRSHKIEIKPNYNMTKYIEGCIGYNRYIYNKCVALYKKFYECNKQIVDDYNKDITDENKKIKYYYLEENELRKIINNNKELWEFKYPSAVKDMAFKRFWRAKERWSIHKISNFPKFHKKNRSTQSFTYDPTKGRHSKLFNDNNKKFKFDHGYTSPVKKKYRWIKLTEKLRFQGKVKQVHISKEYNRYYATFVVELDNLIPFKKKSDGILGIDVGVKTFHHDSDNQKIQHITKQYNIQKHIKQAEFYHKQLMRKLNRNKPSDKQSKNYYKTKTKYNNELRKIANGKNDFYHQLTTMICEDNVLVCTEKLDGKAMRKKQTSLGKGIRRNLSQISFYELTRMFDYKARFFQQVGTDYASTQTCNHCGNRKVKDEKLTIHDRIYICNICGYTQDRDYNAALNIRQEGIRLMGEATRPKA